MRRAFVLRRRPRRHSTRWAGPSWLPPEPQARRLARPTGARPPAAGHGWMAFDIELTDELTDEVVAKGDDAHPDPEGARGRLLGAEVVRVEVRVRLDTVDVRVNEHLAAIFTRAALRTWLTGPVGVLGCDEVAFVAVPAAPARTLAGTARPSQRLDSAPAVRIAVKVRPGVGPAVLPPEVAAQLRWQVRTGTQQTAAAQDASGESPGNPAGGEGGDAAWG